MLLQPNLKEVIYRLLPCFLILSPALVAAEETAGPTFGGPDSVERTIETDHSDKAPLFETEFFSPLEQWQEKIKEDHGFSLGMDYSAVTVNASESLAGTIKVSTWSPLALVASGLENRVIVTPAPVSL